MSKAVKWAWRHYSLDADVYDTLDEAIESAIAAADYGSESLDCIEHDGERITQSDGRYVAIVKRHDREREARQKAARPATHRLEVRHPDGKWVALYRVAMPSAAVAEDVREFVSALGGDRVRVTPLQEADTR